MPLILFLLWIIFNGRVTGDVLVSGALVSLAVYVFCLRFMDYRLRGDRVLLKRVVKLALYMPLLVWEMLKANLQVIGLVLSPAIRIRPCIVYYRPEIKSVFGRVLLANSITLTPGTITGEMTEKSFSVHAITPDMAQGLEGSVFEKRIAEMEGGDE